MNIEKRADRDKCRTASGKTARIKFCETEINELLNREFVCECGRVHKAPLKEVRIGGGVISEIPDVLRGFNAKDAYIVCDGNTYDAAGVEVERVLDKSGIRYNTTILYEGEERIEPCEKTVGSAVMGFDGRDAIVGVGSGTINDICKFLAALTKLPYIIIATAPSMDGYSSNSSSMIYNGVKTTIYTDCPDVIICDTDVLARAPKRMLLAGVGDMAAKYISVCEWRLSNLITCEYYCDEIAAMMRKSARTCLGNAEAFVRGDEKATRNIIEGLILAGIAMSFANTSRPASGTEHYYSHLWEMRAIERGERCDLHGIQVGAGVLLVLDKYEKLRKIVPDRAKAIEHAENFDINAWETDIREYFCSSAEKIIALEKSEHKFGAKEHIKRLDRIIDNWGEILKIIDDELPDAEYVKSIYDKISFPYEPESIGETADSAEKAFTHTKDIRDKYIMTRLLWDIGEL